MAHIRRNARSRDGEKPDEAGVEMITPAPAISDDEVAAIQPAKYVDPEDLPGFLVTLHGTLPKLFASVVIRGGPIRAQTSEAAIARLVQQVGTQTKKADAIDWEAVEAVEMKVGRAPKLPFKDGEPGTWQATS
jgi:hypothetical protein